MRENKAYTDVLGPVFLYWIAHLYGDLSFLGVKQRRKVLFCARAGKRIDDLVSAYAGGTETPFDSELFGISRIAACKLGIGEPETFDTAYEVTEESLGGATIADVCQAYLQHSWDLSDPHMQRLSKLRQPLDKSSFRAFIASNDVDSLWFRKTLGESRSGLRSWLEQSLGSYSGFVLVDSGWKASIQRVLSEVFPELIREGLYFGVIDETPLEGRHGIVFDAPRYVPGRPSTVFALHRHLIETILEANADSVEEVLGGPNDGIARAQLANVAKEMPDPERDALFLQLRDYVAENAGTPIDEVLVRYRKALHALVPMLLNPSRGDAVALAGKDRSIDFGRKGDVPVLAVAKADRPDSPEKRVARSLWPQGQIAIEYDDEHAVRRMQDSATRRMTGIDYFASHERSALKGRAAAAAQGKPRSWSGSVAVVTRTKDRPILLCRAARSIADQSYSNIQWVVVNDGGDSAPVVEIIRKSGVDLRRVTLVDNVESVGMEAASNMGVRAVDTEFVVIHDDDDSWEPDFLKESVAFLSSARATAAGFEGVLSRAWRVSEQIDGDQVIFHEKKPYMPWASEVSISQLAVGNFFAPISFVYRRWVFDDIGGYDETLPVLGDWRFNLDFVIRGNIGFLDKYLSYYHHRDRGDSTKDGVYANSVIGGQSLHAQYFSVVTNSLLRDPNTPPGLIAAIAAAHHQRVLEWHITRTAKDVSVRTQELLQASGGGAGQGKVRIGDIPATDLDHIKRSMRSQVVFDGSMRRMLARLRWEWRLSLAPIFGGQVPWLGRLLPLVPSPADFDHITYLRDHPEIWATVYNGSGELLPYHHYLLEGIGKGYARPSFVDEG